MVMIICSRTDIELINCWSGSSFYLLAVITDLFSVSPSHKIFFLNTDLTVDCIFQAICTEAGLMALRERRMKVTNEDFKKSKENVLYKKQEGTPEGLYL